MKLLRNLQPVPMDPIFKVMAEYASDPRPGKVNLGIGVYRDMAGSPYVFPSVQSQVKALDASNFEYVSMRGNDTFLEHSAELILGSEYSDAVALQQSAGGTHALRLVADFFGTGTFLCGLPTWSNHFEVFENFIHKTFDHLDGHTVNTAAYLKAMQKNPNSILLLHGGVTHNPSGFNFTQTQLDEVLETANAQNIFVLIDAAYLGFGEDMERDAAWVQSAFKKLKRVAVACSFSKNAALYRQRLGALLWKTNSADEKLTLESHLQALVRGTVSNLPDFGASVMASILSNEGLRTEWLSELDAARIDINNRRQALVDLLPVSLRFLQDSKGLFAISGFDQAQVEHLKTKYGIYMPPNGRINFASIRTGEPEIIAQAFASL